jgi:hypothetical protein
VDLDDVGSFDLAQVSPAAPLVDTKKRLKVVQGAAVDVQVVGEDLIPDLAPSSKQDPE